MVNFFRFLSPKRSLAVDEPRADAAAEGLVLVPEVETEQTPSRLLKDVLSGGASAAPEDDHRPPDAPPLSQRLNVGERLARDKRRAVELASKLGANSGEETARLLQTIVQDLDRRVCRIAFVGQMNAGKSSLINVLIEQPELLPADINPWTTVVTNLYFGIPGAPRSGASFTFFSRDEWRRLSIGGRTRELTERIFPGFDWQALKDHVDAMQDRARQKLGASFEHLLGTEHAYPGLTEGLLNRYVGAGLPGPAGFEQGAEGEFSDITKLANVYFDLGAFNFPTTVIDTPGVNDPFLVRDEITRQSLEAADICVIVLTARQPLSTADLNLLRMLRGLNKSRLIIFVNKIDEIETSDDVLKSVAHRIAAVLNEEFPGTHVPIVLGSALWARAALCAKIEAPPPPPKKFAGFTITEAEKPAASFWPGGPNLDDTLENAALFVKSGLPSLALAISGLMQTGPIADAIGAAMGLADALGRNVVACLEIEADLTHGLIDDRSRGIVALDALKASAAAIELALETFSSDLEKVYTREVIKIHEKLTATIKTFAEDVAVEDGSPVTMAQASQVDLRLRVNIENVFLAAFEEATHAMVAEFDRLLAELRRVLAEGGAVSRLAVADGDNPNFHVQPSLAALSEPASMGLSSSFADIATKQLQPGTKDADLRHMIVSDFDPIVKTLTDAAAFSLNQMAANQIEKTSAVTLRPLRLTIDRLAALSDRLAEASPEAARDFAAREEADLRERVSELRAFLSNGGVEKPANGNHGAKGTAPSGGIGDLSRRLKVL